jgi:hypothetical protein
VGGRLAIHAKCPNLVGVRHLRIVGIQGIIQRLYPVRWLRNSRNESLTRFMLSA